MKFWNSLKNLWIFNENIPQNILKKLIVSSLVSQNEISKILKKIQKFQKSLKKSQES